MSAIDPQNGSIRWNLPFKDICDAQVRCYGPWTELVDDTLYVIGGSTRQTLQAFDVSTGKKRFEHLLGFPLVAYDRGGQSLGTAYLLSGSPGPGPVEDAIEAFHLDSGSLAWKFVPSPPQTYQDAISPLILASS
ncbi:MAG TPA: hypothetical protein VKR06_11415 [Ktedonosporobacter sp.]|nr:hypothetical protein [Ktedonosporobacter sp.]